jgi:PIN domain nuclease of toxin-antitoxin system
MAEAIIDASALLALINGEDGADVVAGVIEHSAITAANLSEVVAVLQQRGVPDMAIRALVADLKLDTLDVDGPLAMDAGLLRRATQSLGLSLGDRLCLAVAERERLPVYTADRAWAGLDIGVEIRMIR